MPTPDKASAMSPGKTNFIFMSDYLLHNEFECICMRFVVYDTPSYDEQPTYRAV